MQRGGGGFSCKWGHGAVLGCSGENVLREGTLRNLVDEDAVIRCEMGGQSDAGC
jgi:hypothetical protein